MIQYNKKIKKITYSSKKKNIEQDALDEMNTLTNELKNKAKAEKQLFKANVDANYYTVITFNNAEQLKEFFEKIGLNPDDPQYINGKQFCRKLGIEITSPDRKAPGNFKINSNLVTDIIS